MRDVVTSILGAEFDVIRAVGDGGAALTATTQLLPDVVILDICMPVLNGIDVARRLRDTRSNVAVVFLTACSDIDTFDAAKESGSLAYVLKPRLCSDLVPAINLALSGTPFASPGVGQRHSSKSALIQETASVYVDLMHLRAEALESQ